MSLRSSAALGVPILAICAAVLVLVPMLWLVVAAFRSESDLLNAPFRLFGSTLSTKNFEQLRDLPGFGESLRNSALVASMTMVVTSIMALPLGYLLSRYEFRWRTVLRAVSLSGYLIAPVVLALPYFRVLSELGLIDSLAGIVIAHTAFAFPVALVLAEMAVRSVPIELEEVAILDGTALCQRLVRVVLPYARYQIAAMLLLIFTISWKEFFFAFLISGSDNTKTLPVLLAALNGGESQHWPMLCAVATILLLPSTVMLLWRPTHFSPTAGTSIRG